MGHIRLGGHGTSRTSLSLSLSLSLFLSLALFFLFLFISALPLRALTLWPQFRVVSHKVKSISPECGRSEFHRYLIYTYVCHISKMRYSLSWNDKRLYFPPPLSPSLLPRLLFYYNLYMLQIFSHEVWTKLVCAINLMFSHCFTVSDRCSSK